MNNKLYKDETIFLIAIMISRYSNDLTIRLLNEYYIYNTNGMIEEAEQLLLELDDIINEFLDHLNKK